MSNTDSKPTSEKKQTQAPQISPHTSTYTQQIEDGTIDLYELWITLWNKKWFVLAIMAISALGSVVYTLYQPVVYKAEALLLPPKAKHINSLHALQEVKEEKRTETKIVFSAFVNNLKSRSLQKKFIEEQGLMDILAPSRTPETRDIEILESFASMIKVENIENGEGISVSMETDNPDFAAKLINDYIHFFDLETMRELSTDVRSTIEGRIRDVEYSISSKKHMEIVRREDQIRQIENSIFSKREMSKKQREDQIHKIENTIKSARITAKKRREDKIKEIEETIRSMGVEDKVDTTNVVKNNQLNLSTTGIPLYNRALSPEYKRKTLRAEIELLKKRESDDPFISGLRDWEEDLARLRSRKSDDPFIKGLRELQVKVNQLRTMKSDYTFFPGLRSLQEKLALLRSIKIKVEGQHAVTIDQAAYPPKNYIKPKYRQIILLGTSVGLILGIFLAFFVSFIQKQKEIHSA